MKKGLTLILMLAGLSGSALATVLSDAANALQPGQWTTISTNNINPTLTNTGGASGFIFGYTDRMAWYPQGRKIYFAGGDHNETNPVARFVNFDETTNSWTNMATPSWVPSSGIVIHGYGQQTVDPVRGYFYGRDTFGNVMRRFNIVTGVWSSTPANNLISYVQCCGTYVYFPEMDSTLWFNPGEFNDKLGIFRFSENTSTWTRVGAANTYTAGIMSVMAIYNPVHHLIWFGGGGSDRHGYKLLADGTVVALANAPVDLGNGAALKSVDPVTGLFLVWSSSTYNTGWYTYNVITDTWTFINSMAPIFQGNLADPSNPQHGMTATPIPEYNVTFIVKCLGTGCTVYLYKHLPGGTQTLPPPPPGDATPPSVPSGLSPTVISLSQINLAWTASTDNVGVAGYKIFRNGSQVGTSTVTNFQNTGLSASTTYNYSVTAYDAAGNNSSPSASVSATTSATIVITSNFQTRCNGPGVVRCFDFDNLVVAQPYFNTQGPTPTIDTSIKASGSGSLKFTIPSNDDGGYGSFSMNFTPNSPNCLTATSNNCSASIPYGTQYGPGQTFYVQWRQRFEQGYLDYQFPGGGGWKQSIIGEGDHQGGIAATACTELEIVTQNTNQVGFPRMYHSCGVKDGKYQPIEPTLNSVNIMEENALPYPPGCIYPVNAGSNCFRYVANEWLTFQVQVTVGTWYKNDGVYHYDSQIKLWAAREGQPSLLLLDTSLIASNGAKGNQHLEGLGPSGSSGGYDLVNLDPATVKYGKVWLTPFHTGVTNSSHPTWSVWYDELIVSTQKIPDPVGTPGTGDSTPPAAPVSLRITN